MDIKNLISLGQVAVFYIPIFKLDILLPNGKTPRLLFEEYLMENYNAYTLEISNTQGFWREHHKSEIFSDENARYEVSFDGKDRVPPFVEFLSFMCSLIGEKAIYLTMGQHSWLVLPKEKNEVSSKAP